MMEERKQIYGSYVNQIDQYPLWKLEGIDQLRDSLDMPPFWYLKEVYDNPFPDNYSQRVSD